MMGSFSIWHWLIVLVVVMAIFGTRKLRNAGGDLGSAVRNFKAALREGEEEAGAGAAVEAQPCAVQPSRQGNDRA